MNGMVADERSRHLSHLLRARYALEDISITKTTLNGTQFLAS
jgi:hypothetical protein